jgi:hypothetical protein
VSPDESIDRDLRAVFDGLVTAIYVTKQLVWSTTGARRDQLQNLLAFLIEQSHLVDEAEARIDGRAATMAAPSSHERRNLLGDVGNDMQAALTLYVERVTDLAIDISRRASDMGDRHEAHLLVGISKGLQTRVVHLLEGS